MKSNLKYFISLFSIILILFFINDYQNNSGLIKDYRSKLNLPSLKDSFNEKQNQLLSKIQEIELLIDSEDSLPDYFYHEESTLYDHEKIGIFLFKNNELKYWSTNNIPLPVSTTPFFFSEKIINLTNGWYFVESSIYENYHIVALVQIKQEYSFENDLLESGYNKAFKDLDGYDIILDETKNSIPVIIGQDIEFYIIQSKSSNKNSPQYIVLLLYFLIIINIILILYKLFIYLSYKIPSKRNTLLLTFIIIVVLGRYLMLFYKIPSIFHEFRIFSPELFAESYLLPSLGDYIINVVLFLILSFIFSVYFKLNIIIKENRIIALIFSAVLSVLLLLSSIFVFNLFESLVKNSSISFNFHNITDLNHLSLLGLFIISSVIIGIMIIFDTLIKEFKAIVSFKTLLIFFSITLICLLVFLIIYNKICLNKVLYSILFLFLWIVIVYSRLVADSFSYYKFVIIIFIISLITSYEFTALSNEKDIESAKVLAYNLSAERDIGAEFFLNEIYSSIIDDKEILKANKSFNFERLRNLITNKILSNRYLNRYDLQLTICLSGDSLLIEPDYIHVGCFDFFTDIKKKYGFNLSGTNFYFLDNHNGRISYFGEFSFPGADNQGTKVFVELNSKIFSEGLGYPELLLEKRLTVKRNLKNYNYAKYNKGKLVTSRGTYKYPILLKYNVFGDESQTGFRYNSYIHYKYNIDNENVIILSKEASDYSQELVSFSYIFTILFLAFHFLILVLKIVRKTPIIRMTLKNKIQISFISILLLSLIITGTISIYFIVKGYKAKQSEFLEDKVQSILTELETEFGHYSDFDVNDIKFMNYLLIKLSNVFYTDINLYDTEGKLFATSRKELYDQGLKGRYLDTKAYKELILNSSGSIILNEEIGKVNYLSAYLPFRNHDNELIAYLNLPYFARQNEFREEISNFIVAFSNVFLVLILISVIIGIFISKQVTRPLSIIQQKIRMMDINKKAEKIKYDKDDELGGLIREYNRKVDELTESVNQLAKSEREMAWREMAKQIAHEIKNPLTPMKLSIQYLEQAYERKDGNWEKTFKRVTKTIIEQIDVLSEIATEFSHFAKMPESKKETNNLIEIIYNTVQLFKSFENIRFITSINIESKGIIKADKEQLTRVFNNLIKNSIQAIPHDRNGLINIIVDENEKDYIVTVKDNGKGIDETMIPKIFQPNFTTKSGGMGLGLSMVKNIIDSNGGKISFKTVKDKGTEFIIEIPKKKGR